MTTQKQILSKAQSLFFKYGVKNLTMDEIAKELGMSKKTIYLYVKNKSDLVLKCTKDYFANEARQLVEIASTSKDSIEEMYKLIIYLTSNLKEFNSVAYYDLQKYYPDSFELLVEYKEKQVLKYIRQNLENGIKQGLYRKDVDVDVISKIYISAVDLLINNQVFPIKKYNFQELYTLYMDYHLRGILSADGLKNYEFFKTKK